MNPISHGLGLVHPDGLPGGNDLAVQISDTDLVAIDQLESADAAARQSLRHIAADSPDAENGHFTALKFLHRIGTQKDLRAQELVLHVPPPCKL